MVNSVWTKLERSPLESLVTRREINWVGILLPAISSCKKLPFRRISSTRGSEEEEVTVKETGEVIGGKLIDSEMDPGWKLDLGESLVNKLVG